MALFSCFGTEPHVELWKGKTLGKEPSGIQGFIASCQFKVVICSSGPVVIGFVRLPGGIICSPRCGEALLHLDPECTDLVGTGQSPKLLFFRWLSCAEWWLLPFCFFVLGSVLLWNELWASSDFLISFNPGFLCFHIWLQLHWPFFCSSYFPSSPSHDSFLLGLKLYYLFYVFFFFLDLFI